MTPKKHNVSALVPAKKDADGEKPGVILQQITVRPISRGNVDIQKWRNALKAAEATNPRRVLLYDLYKDILLDGHVISVTNKRIMGVTNADWVYFDKSGKEVPHMMEFIDSPGFEKLVGEMVNSRMWGYSMVEMTFRPDDRHSAYLIPRKHIRPENGWVMREQNGFDGFSIREGRYRHTVIEAGDPLDLGLLLVVAQYAIYKRGNFGDWAGYNEVFGTPLIDAVWDGFNEDQRIKLLDSINNVGNGGAIVRPAGTELSTLTGTGSGQNTGELWDKLKEAMNKEISKAILGQTETTESSAGSGYAQAKQHGETEDDVNKSDIKFVRQLLNHRLIPMMEAHGIDVSDGYFAVRNYGEETLSLLDRIEIDRKLKVEMKLPMGDDYLYDKYGIEKPANYNELVAERQAAEQAALVPPPQPGAPPEDKPKPKAKDVKMRDRFWIQKLRDLFQSAPETGVYINTLVADIYGKDALCCAHGDLDIQLSMIDDATIRRWYEQATAGGSFDNGIFSEIAEEITGGVAKELDLAGPRVTDPVTPIYENLRENIYKFSHAKTKKQLEAFNTALQESSSFAQFRNRVIKIDEEYNDRHLRTEYNTAQAIAQMAKQMEYLKRFDMLMIRTVGDDKVRLTHQGLDGVILPYADIVRLGLVPPFDWNCRCTLLPAQGMQEVGRDRAEAFAALMNPYFQRNMAITQEAFSPEHPHFIDAPEELRASDYNLPEPQQLVNDPTLPEITRITDQAAAISIWQGMGEEMQMNDGVRWNLFGDIDTMTSDGRWRYVPIFREMLTAASEIWTIRRAQQTIKHVVKYYRGQPVVMIYPVDNPRDWTIIEMVPDENGQYTQLIEDIRRGSLIYNAAP